MPARANAKPSQRASSERPSRGRPRTVDTERVLEVAREVFLERGAHATTLEVAQRVGLSEGAIFHRFKTKEALFRAAMRFDELEFSRRISLAIEEMQGLEVQDALVHLGRQVLAISKVALPLSMMSWSNPAVSTSAVPSVKDHSYYRRISKQFVAYCDQQVTAGKLRPLDAVVFASAFVGAINNYTMAQLLAGYPVPPADAFLREMIDLFLNGVLPRAALVGPPGKRRPQRRPRRLGR